MAAAHTIDEVLIRLDTIVAHSIIHKNPHGAFAALYRRVTAGVKEKIAQNYFDDGPRMERLDVIFANRYLDAWDAVQAGGPVSASWQVAFSAASQPNKLLLQHLLLGMNAHINLDLGVAAATVCPGEEIHGLQADFDRINDLLVDLVDQVQDHIRSVSPLLGVVDHFFKERDEQFAGFSLKAARLLAWRTATRLAALGPEQERTLLMTSVDEQVARIGERLANPRKLLSWALKLIYWFESKEVSAQVNAVSTAR